MAEPLDAKESVQRLVARIKELEEEKTKATSEKGQLQAEIDGLKKQIQDIKDAADAWLL